MDVVTFADRLRYRVNNPSAWDHYDEGASALFAEAATTLERAQAHLMAATEASEQFERAFFAEQAQVEALRKVLEMHRALAPTIMATLMDTRRRDDLLLAHEVQKADWTAMEALAALSAPAEESAVYPAWRPDREEIARLAWNRFAPNHNVSIEEDGSRAEYLHFADAILALPNTPKAEAE